MALTRDGRRIRAVLGAALGVMIVLALATPLFGADVQALLMAAFSPLCHQLPERSLWIAGGQVPLCHRCTGIGAGLLVGLLVAPLNQVRLDGGWVLALAFLPIAVDWGLAALGVWENSFITRIITGMWAGLLLGGLIARAASVNPDCEDFVAAE